MTSPNDAAGSRPRSLSSHKWALSSFLQFLSFPLLHNNTLLGGNNWIWVNFYHFDQSEVVEVSKEFSNELVVGLVVEIQPSNVVKYLFHFLANSLLYEGGE